MTLRFNMLLEDEDIDPADVRLLRHQTRKVPGRTPFTLWRDNVREFERYQSYQAPTSFQRARFDAKYWASFVAPPDHETLFVGLYKVRRTGSVPPSEIDPLSRRRMGDREGPKPYDLYEFQRCRQLSRYIGRLLVHWGDSSSAARAWIQRAERQDKEIVELRLRSIKEPMPVQLAFVR